MHGRPIQRFVDAPNVGREHVGGGGRIAAILLVAAIAAFGCVTGARDAVAGPTCPGQDTTDGLACCAPGATPTANDACQLPGGGQAASCPLAQLTSSGACCPPGAAVQPDGTCQSNGYTVQACPLGQLDKSGLTCCPSGQAPQADGSCQQTVASPSTPPAQVGISACPSGFVFQAPLHGCMGVPSACPIYAATLSGNSSPVDVQETPVTGNDDLGAVPNPGFTLGCCPWPSQQVTPTSACFEGGAGALVAVAPVAPTCPPGSTPNNFFNSGIYFCIAKAACPARFHVDENSGMCDLNPIGIVPHLLSELDLSDTGSCRSGSVPRRAFAGDDVCVSVSVGAATLVENVDAPTHTNPDGSCIQGYKWRLNGPSDHACVAITPPTSPMTITCSPGFAYDAYGKCVTVAGNCPAGAVQIDGKCVELPKVVERKPNPQTSTGRCPNGTPPDADGNCGEQVLQTQSPSVCRGSNGFAGPCQCDTGYAPQRGFVCCPFGTIAVGGNAQCQPICPNGATDWYSVVACMGGYYPVPVNGVLGLS